MRLSSKKVTAHFSMNVSRCERRMADTGPTTEVEQFDKENGLVWSQVDDHTIEVSLPD